jgi:hypothetical protein
VGRILRVIGLAVAALVACLVLAVLGQRSAVAFLHSGWGRPAPARSLYLLGLGLAFAAAVVPVVAARAGHPISRVIRLTLVAFALLFCTQLIIGAVPDRSPLPLYGGILLCITASLAALVMPLREPLSAEPDPPD